MESALRSAAAHGVCAFQALLVSESRTTFPLLATWFHCYPKILVWNALTQECMGHRKGGKGASNWIGTVSDKVGRPLVLVSFSRSLSTLTICENELLLNLSHTDTKSQYLFTYTVITITSSNQTFSGQLLHVSGQNWIWPVVRLGHRNCPQVGDSADLECLPAVYQRKHHWKFSCMVKIYECQVKLDFARHSVCTLLPSYWEHCIHVKGM